MSNTTGSDGRLVDFFVSGLVYSADRNELAKKLGYDSVVEMLERDEDFLERGCKTFEDIFLKGDTLLNVDDLRERLYLRSQGYEV